MKILIILGVMLISAVISGCADECEVCGKYEDPTNKEEYIELRENGTYRANFIGQDIGAKGEYNLENGMIKLFSGGEQLTIELSDNMLRVSDGSIQIERFVKEGNNKTVELTPSETVNAFIELYFDQKQVEKAQKYVYSGDRSKLTNSPTQEIEWRILSQEINNNSSAQVEAELKLIEDTGTGPEVKETQIVKIDLVKENGEWRVTSKWEGESQSQGSEVSKEVEDVKQKPVPLEKGYDVDYTLTHNKTLLMMNLSGPSRDLTVELRKDNHSILEYIDSQDMNDGYQRIQFDISKGKEGQIMTYEIFVRSENKTVLHRIIEFEE